MRHRDSYIVLLALVWLTITGTGAAELDVRVQDAWIPSAPPNAPVLAGYLTLENHSEAGISLVGATSPMFGNITFHRTELREGVARMTHVPQVDIAAHKRLVLQPGGYHLMLARPARALHRDDRIPIELQFKDGRRLSSLFTIRAPGAVHDSTGTPTDHHSMTH